MNVRVILDQHLEKSANTAAYNYLAAHGVHVRWGPAGTTYHQKTLTVDDATSVIMTLNLVTEDYRDTRDFAVIDTNRADVAAIVTTFNADFAGQADQPARRSRPGVVAHERAGICPVGHQRGEPVPSPSKKRRWTIRRSLLPWPPQRSAAWT